MTELRNGTCVVVGRDLNMQLSGSGAAISLNLDYGASTPGCPQRYAAPAATTRLRRCVQNDAPAIRVQPG